MRRLLAAPVGLVVVLALWWLAAGPTSGGAVLVPSPPAVVLRLWGDGWRFYGPNVAATIGEAARGFLWGDLAAAVVAIAVLLAPVLRRVAVQLATVSYCVPVVAIGPLLTVVFSGRTPAVALASLSVFFTTLTGLLLGLGAAPSASLDLIDACGGNAWDRFRKVQLFACLPALFASLGIAAPTALLGAILGEWLGSVQSGLGLVLVNAMQTMDAARVWGIALVCGAVASGAYLMIQLAGRLLMPWRAAAGGGDPA